MSLAAGVSQEDEARPAAPGLRAWQRKALVDYLRRRPQDFLAVATPGAGKTTFALRVATEMLADGTVDQLTVVAPTDHLKSQWAQAAARVGIQLDPTFSNTVGGTSSDFHGIVVTYAQVGLAPAVHRRRTTSRRTLVILDEIHHAGDARTWGDGVKLAFDPAVRRLALTGTPFRSDDNAIPFVTYERDREGLRRSQSDYSYGYGDALREGVVRPVIFMAYSGETRWRTSAGEELSARLGEPLTKEQTAQAWRTALDPKGEWMPAVLRAADARLKTIRQHVPDAAGLVIASDHQAAKAYAELLRKVTGQTPVTVLSDDRTASAKIATFTASEDRWMVAVRMVSEGVDIPRLMVGVYATSASTPLYFAQAIGRFVRARRPGETASIFLPSVPNLLALAEEMEAQRDHVLDRPHRESDGLDDALLEAANKEENEGGADGDLPKFTALEASAQLDQVIYDGASFGTGAVAGTAEEEEYLGLPGLLEPDQVAMLLSKRQADQIAAQAKAPKPSAPPLEQVRTTYQRRADLRRQLNTLVAAHHHRTGRPHGQIHAELRKICGGPPSAQASIEQLEERIVAVQQL
ncbi:DEAD/DEAH box helicase [Fodinicola acaciae]|uniref:DEAD/DEAH box helicase n=1 Tax=Fodinicola acaciae TaxID=2681555 RepID=UPI0013D5E31B|nr:DEAD/DEAH box helicase [Fodinicola acaciae]